MNRVQDMSQVRCAASRRRWLGEVGMLTIALLASTGCGGSGTVGYVKGSLRYDGAPVPADTRVFFELPGKGYLAAGIVQEDGTYVLRHKRSEEITPGDFVVFIGPPPSRLSESEYRALKAKVDADFRSRGKRPPPSPDWVLPLQYYQSATSPLRQTVAPGENVIDLTLDD